MTKISSSIGKRLPLFGAAMGFIGFTAAIVMPTLQSSKPFPPQLFLALIFFPFVGYVLYSFFRGSVDEVWDTGDALLIKNKGHEMRIPLADIVNLSYSAMSNPPRATILLRNPTQMGKEIIFFAKRPTFSLSWRNAAIDDLIQRIDAARRQ